MPVCPLGIVRLIASPAGELRPQCLASASQRRSAKLLAFPARRGQMGVDFEPAPS